MPTLCTSRRPAARRSARSLLAGLAMAAAITSAPQAQTEATDTRAPKIVVELFTSQGCIACPPADAFLAELAERDNVIALSMHVDYWDYLGWPDPFAQAQFSERQRAYIRQLGGYGRGVTPQMIVHGDVGVAGAHPSVVSMSIESAENQRDLVILAIRRDGDRLLITITPTRAGQAIRLSEPIPIVVVGYDGPHSVNIGAGENDGSLLTYHNVARDFRIIGAWPGGETSLETEIDTDLNGYAVFVQLLGPGRIVGAEAIEFD